MKILDVAEGDNRDGVICEGMAMVESELFIVCNNRLLVSSKAAGDGVGNGELGIAGEIEAEDRRPRILLRIICVAGLYCNTYV